MLRRLKQLRESKLLTQRKLSSASGVAISTVVRLEKCQQKPNLTTIKRLSAALGVRPEELVATSYVRRVGDREGVCSSPKAA